MVKVTAMSAEQTHEVPFGAGQTVRAYVEAAGGRIDGTTGFSLNGRPVQPDEVVAEDDSVLIAGPKIVNG